MKKFITLLTLLIVACTTEGFTPPYEAIEVQDPRESVIVESEIFKIEYNEILEQPVWVEYTVQCPLPGVDRGSMDFYTEKDVYTSDSKDYYRNIYDKGHLAPAATYSDTMENLKKTFSYLNCALQDQYLNRGEWRLLEEEERKWDDQSNLTVTVELVFDKGHIVLPTGGHVPTDMIKHIKFDKTGSYRCFEFENVKPTKSWKEHEVKHTH